MKGYAEGGTAREDNPYPVGSNRWRLWERKHGRDPDAEAAPPPPPPVAEAEPEKKSWADRLREYAGIESAEDIDRQVEEMQARGGRVGYQMGGEVEPLMQELRGRMSPPMGGVPPRVEMQGGGLMGRARQAMAQGRGTRRVMGPQGRELWRGRSNQTPPSGLGQLPPGIDPRAVAADPEGYRRSLRGGPTARLPGANDPNVGIMQAYRNAGMPSRAMPPVRPGMIPPGKMPPGGRMMVPPSAPPNPDMPSGPVGGPRIPSNLRGMLQRRMMENRPRRGIPGPAGAGGAPNRVGQSDQQGGLSRALQRGTGRPPMSRRSGFYR